MIRRKYTLDETIAIVVLLGKGHDIDEVSKLSGRSRGGLRSKFKIEKNKVDGPTSSRSIKQYSTIEELYEAFGEICPTDPEELQKDIDRRYLRWMKRLLEEVKEEAKYGK